MLKGDPSWEEESRMKGTEEERSAVLQGGGCVSLTEGVTVKLCHDVRGRITRSVI